jgi:hypothetical protein
MPLLNERNTPEEETLALKWYRVRAKVREQFNLRPDINAMLFIIGMNEVGQVREQWEKEEKQELMHVATCKLLSYEGLYRYLHTDEEGWPHYIPVAAVPPVPLKDQDELLKKLIVRYFEEQQLI